MLMIILGAGASYDSYASRPPRSETKEPHRPPLADELFEDRPKFNELLERFNKCQEILPQLREQSNRKALEAYLERLREEAKTFLQGGQQLRAVQFYIQGAIEHCESGWRAVHRGATNHLALLNRVERWRARQNESVNIVTFNYDTLVEEALRSYLGHTFQYLNDYVRRPDYKLFKLHGSVDWGHVTRCALRDNDYNNLRAIQQHIIDGVNSNGTIIYPDHFETKSAEEDLKKKGLVLSPAIAIPVKNKNSFECPKDHVEALKIDLPRVTKILVIGWRAQEQHFAQELQVLPKNIRTFVVGGNAADVKQTVDGLMAAGAKGDYTQLKRGFSYFLEHDEMLDKFLYD
jgi:hypothetical protein